MPVLKVKQNGEWKELGGTSPMEGGNADTLDGKHASEFASAANVNELQTDVSNLQININNLQSETDELQTSLNNLQTKVGDSSVSEQINNALANFESGKTLTEHLAEEMMVLTPLQYGDTLPDPGVVGRIFFKKVVQ